MSILIIDDTRVDQIVTKLVLQKGGYTDLLVASSALEAFRWMGIPEGDPAPEAENIDVICVDWQMPEVDGLEFCRVLKADVRYQDIPIIMVTGSDEEETLVHAFDAGVLDFVRKPIKSVEFLARIKVAHRLKKETDARKAQQDLLSRRYTVLANANEALRNALLRIKKLPTKVPVCSVCHKIKMGEDEWLHVDEYIRRVLEGEVQLSICPDCYRERIARITHPGAH